MRFPAPLSLLLLLGGTIVTEATSQAPKPASKPAMVQVLRNEHVLPLQGGRNFRDMGGYRTRDGRHVRWGMLYRSGAMAGLTQADYAYLNRLGIRSVCDLRTPDERKSEPTLWTGKHEYWLSDLADSGSNLRAMFAGGGKRTPETMREAMVNMYRSMPLAQKTAFAHIFRELVAGRVPLAFNCTAGKDRTGAAAALILTALGVPRETVIQDYLLTNELVDARTVIGPLAGNMAPELSAPLARADKAYIDMFFATIEQRYGSVENYLRKELGVGPAELRKMRARFLT